MSIINETLHALYYHYPDWVKRNHYVLLDGCPVKVSPFDGSIPGAVIGDDLYVVRHSLTALVMDGTLAHNSSSRVVSRQLFDRADAKILA